MGGVPWSERLVEVIACLRPSRHRYGSGCIVAGKTVLTAAHVIAGAVSVTVRDTNKRSYPAQVSAEFTGDPDGPGPDLALLEIDELPGDGFPPFSLGRVIRDSVVPVVIERCHAFGYPGFAEYRAGEVPSRDSVQVVGVIAPMFKFPRGLLSMVVSIAPAPLSAEQARARKSPWSGMSGGPVVAEERLVGVVVEHSLPEGASAITVVPLTALEADPAHPLWGPGVPDPSAWWRRLAADGPASLHPVPAFPPTPQTAGERKAAYLAQVERIAPGELNGRAKELADLAEFCSAPDRGPYLWLRAPAWAGKSALLSWFVLHPPPRVTVVSFFVTARFASQDDRVAFADAILEQALALRGQPVPALLTEATRDAHMLTQLNEAAAVCLARGGRLVLVVDGLDEDRGTGEHSIAALLPARPVAGMRVIVASRPNPPLPTDVPDDHPLRDPATVRPLESSPYAQRTKAITQREIKRLLAGQPGDRELLGLVAAAGGGLTARDLGELTAQQAWQVGDRLRATAGRTFATRAGIWESQETYVLGHEELQEDAITLLGEQVLQAYRQRLHDWAEVYAGRGWPDNTPDFLLQGYFRLVLATGPLSRLVILATDSARQGRMLARSGTESAAAAELALTLDALVAQDPPDLPAITTAAVLRDVMIQRNRDISPDLPVLWARLGAHARAEALARSINDPAQRAVALKAIAAAVAPPALAAGKTPASPAANDLPVPVDLGSVEWHPSAITSGAAIAAAMPRPGSRDEEPLSSPAAHSPLVPVDSGNSGPDDTVKRDVQALIWAARSAGETDRLVLFDAAESTAFTAADPELRASLWNDVTWARNAAATLGDVQAGPCGPSTRVRSSLDDGSPEFARMRTVIERAAAAGGHDRAAAIASAFYHDYLPYGLLPMIVEGAARAGDLVHAEEIALSFSGGWERDRALDLLVDTALEAGLAVEAERVARTLLALNRPESLIKVGRSARDGGDVPHARELFGEVLNALEGVPSWAQASSLADVVRAMAEIGDAEAAISAAIARGSGITLAQALLAVAQVARDRGEREHARMAAARALQEALAAPPGNYGLPEKAARMLATVGAAEVVFSAVASADMRRQTAVLREVAWEALNEGDMVVAEAAADLMADRQACAALLPSFISAYLQADNHTAALAFAQRMPDARLPARLVTEAMKRALDDGAFDIATTLVQKAQGHDARVRLGIDVVRVAVESAAPAQAHALLEAAEAAARSAPHPAWRARALTEAAWALLPGPSTDRVGPLATAAEAAARAVTDAEPRAAALVNVAAVMAVSGNSAHADQIFQEASQTSPIPSSWAEELAARAMATADRGHRRIARAQAAAVGSVSRWTTEPNDRIRAEQAWLAAAIQVGDLRQAKEAAHAIQHPDQQALALINLTRALAATGQVEPAIAVALGIATEERQADALYEVTRLAAARGEFRLAEQAARGIIARGGKSPALLAIAWEAARVGDLTRAEQIIASIPDQGWREVGLQAIDAQRDVAPAPRVSHLRPGTEIARAGQQTHDLLSRADAEPDYPAAARLLAEAIRAGLVTPALAPLSRVDPSAVLAAADTLLTLLQ